MQIVQARSTVLQASRLLLVTSDYSHHLRDFATTTTAVAARRNAMSADVYFSAAPESLQLDGGEVHASHGTGGLFSLHGSSPIGGRHASTLGRALGEFDTLHLRLGRTLSSESLLEAGARRSAVIESITGLIGILSEEGLDLPVRAVVVQSRELPPALLHGVSMYLAAEAGMRDAIMVPLESTAEEIMLLRSRGIERVDLFVTRGADATAWQKAFPAAHEFNYIEEDATYEDLTFGIADRWRGDATGFDLSEPVIASYWIPHAIRERRIQVVAETMRNAARRVAPLAAEKDLIVYGRYAGGLIAGAVDDRDLFSLFKRNVSFEVIEPGRPVLRALADRRDLSVPVPEGSLFDLEPSDEQLAEWMDAGVHLVSLIFHSGELSHDDGLLNVLDLATLTGVPVGIPVHAQRYRFDPEAVEPMYVPREQRGSFGLAEPILHSSGFGVIAEGLADPETIVRSMARARDEIATIAGPANAPRGVYAYLDASPRDWDSRPLGLWGAIRRAGFEYVLSSVAPGANRILHRDGEFVVLNSSSSNFYPSSPFVRVNGVQQMTHAEREQTTRSHAGWQTAVIDMPIFASGSYLLLGQSLPAQHSPQNYPGAHLGRFFEYILSGGETRRLRAATPHTIARYARLLSDAGIIAAP